MRHCLIFKALFFSILLAICGYLLSTNVVSLTGILWFASATIDHRLWTKAYPELSAKRGLRNRACELNAVKHH
jgi:hypothetical protein